MVTCPSSLTNVGSIVGPLLVLGGIFFLLIEVGRPFNAPMAFLNYATSWMSPGVILQPILIGLGLLYALLPYGFADFKTSAAGIVIGSLAALLAVLVGIYHGVLFSQAWWRLMPKMSMLPFRETGQKLAYWRTPSAIRSAISSTDIPKSSL